MNTETNEAPALGVSHRVTVNLPQDMAKRIESICEAKGWTFDEYLTRAAQACIEREENALASIVE